MQLDRKNRIACPLGRHYAGIVNLAERLKNANWAKAEDSLRESGYARLGALLEAGECRGLIELYPREELFRSRIEMARYRFGLGDYQYFSYPLPELVQTIRSEAYPPLSEIANRWMGSLGTEVRYPETLAQLLSDCGAGGQSKPTPLLLHYEAGGYNCLHQDLYGDLAFPFQIVCFLSQPGRDYRGGEFLLVEQRLRAQSIGEAIQCEAGEALVFTTRHKPVKGARGYYRSNVRHGVSRVHWGNRYTLGIIFHDAE